jgi:hypothetical protein
LWPTAATIMAGRGFNRGHCVTVDRLRQSFRYSRYLAK